MKRAVLEALKKNKDIFISGEELSKKIGVTRTAVWKHIKQLKEEGYEIESVSRKGYRMIKEPDTLDANALEIEVASKHIGRKIHHFESIDSTNTLAKKMAAEGAPEGTVIIAEEQTGGRGRLGRTWESPKGTGIWMSIILRPNIVPTEATKITQITAAAVAMGLRSIIGDDVGIKWPNDIIIHKKKTCGILTEMSAELNSVNYIVVGIGINVNVDPNEFPEEVRGVATSIKAYTGMIVSRKNIVKEILHAFEDLYLDFIEKNHIEKSMEICKKYSVTLGKQVKIRTRQKEVIAEAVDLTEDGQLLIKNELGEIEKVLSGEVSVRGLTDYV
ncbi:biotin--[acetyl-CoA-carboxylase] ligase [Crassaminicella profunda]|uniref:biotin--[acetyl-CoA-carboxylase] ligase n=1 Tax=Crassaminicella profunda TaxID=1286698 RepID=UPI001CA764B6|nr:biotin--[acetyl-CoA-carboxylase] ligase [Crassaminicella profunda]QZY54705.1 biotin--[acetyl-CoA-carboxylase] ligase [Crassaminicella profunda]